MFICNLCDNKACFSTAKGLNIHVKWRHDPGSKFKKHDCSKCAFSATSLGRLLQHDSKYHLSIKEEDEEDKETEENDCDDDRGEKPSKNNSQQEQGEKVDICGENLRKKLFRQTNGIWSLAAKQEFQHSFRK